MPYIQSPTGIYHYRPRGSQRTRCGEHITDGWAGQAPAPEDDLAHTCDRCRGKSGRLEAPKMVEPHDRGEREGREIEQVQRDAKETPKIG